MNIFQIKSLPLTIGIISNHFGNDTTLVEYIQDGLNSDWPFNVGLHGYNHEDFSELSYDEQYQLLVEGSQQIQQVLKVTPTVFIPPYNAFNNDTIQALEASGYTHLSSQELLDPPPYTTSGNPPLWRFPAGASTGDSNEYYGVPWNVTYEEIQQQLKDFGFSVVMMHPQEYAWNNELNTEQLNQLETLISAVVEDGLKLVLLVNIQDYFNTP